MDAKRVPKSYKRRKKFKARTATNTPKKLTQQHLSNSKHRYNHKMIETQTLSRNYMTIPEELDQSNIAAIR